MHHLACHQWSKLQRKLTTLGYCNKNLNRGGLKIYFSEPPSPEVLDLSLYPKKFYRKQASSVENSPKLCDTSWKFQGRRNQDQLKLNDLFMYTPGIFTFSLGSIDKKLLSRIADFGVKRVGVLCEFIKKEKFVMKIFFQEMLSEVLKKTVKTDT